MEGVIEIGKIVFVCSEKLFVVQVERIVTLTGTWQTHFFINICKNQGLCRLKQHEKIIKYIYIIIDDNENKTAHLFGSKCLVFL